MSLKQNLSKIQKLRKELLSLEKSAAKDLIDSLKDLIKNNPDIEAIKWAQYTPNFNDGEPCVFDIHGVKIKFNDSIHKVSPDDELDDSSSGYVYTWDIDDSFFSDKADIVNHEDIKKLQRTYKSLDKMIDHLCSLKDQLCEMFGDGVEITLTETGIEVEDFDHD